MKVKYCLKCGGELKTIEDGQHYQCSKCEYVYFRNSKLTVNAIIFDEQGRILLGKREGVVKEGMWDTPGGYLENGEDIIEGLKRIKTVVEH